MKPYFEQGGVTIYHAACVDLLATLAPRSVGLVLTDPPYTKRVHSGMRSNKGRRGSGKAGAARRGGEGPGMRNGKVAQSVNAIDFPPFSEEESAAAFDAMGRVARRWVVATTALEHAAYLSENPPPGLAGIRTGAWCKIGPTPQMTGDRPGQGWEAIAILHAEDPGQRMHWNGGGRSAVYHFQAEMHGVYPTQKPEPLMSRLLLDFADSSDDALDPFCGSGTTLLCAWRLGHRAVGCDVREEACEIAARRIEAAMRQGRMPLAPPPTEQAPLF